MEKTLYDKNGKSVAYIFNDYQGTIFLWEGVPVAYLYEDIHLYGINGKHLGFFIDEIIYDNNGFRQGFTSSSCPVPVGKEEGKPKREPVDELRSRWDAPPMANLTFNFSDRDFSDFLADGQVERTLFGSEIEQ